MKYLPRVLWVATVTLVFASASTFAATAEKKAPTKNPRPTVKVDSTPLEAKAGLVVSYADVLDPVQKAVVSIYSTKIVHERIGNPLLRQLFPACRTRSARARNQASGRG
jgi:serine protease Do